MAAAEPHLRVVPLVADRSTGELVEVTLASLAAENQTLRDEQAELLRKFKGQSRELAELKRDKLADAEADALWPLAVRLFAYHNRVFAHPKAEWSVARFEMARVRLKKPGLEGCLRAIAGRRVDSWYVEQGLTMFDDVFETLKKFERCLAKCPRDWTPPRGMPAPLDRQVTLSAGRAG